VVDSAQLVGGCQWGWREEERRKAFGGKNILGEIAAVFFLVAMKRRRVVCEVKSVVDRLDLRGISASSATFSFLFSFFYHNKLKHNMYYNKLIH